MGGGKSQTSTQSVSIPPEVLARYNAVNARAETAATQPFSQYGGEFVAPLSGTQQAGIYNTNAAANQAQPYYGAATALTAGAAQNVGPLTQQQIGYYQNPYTQAVVNPTVQALQQQQGQQLAQQQAEAIKSGAAFGERSGLQRAQLQGQQNLALGQAIAPLYQQGYTNAAQIAAGQQGVVASDLARQMQAGQQLAGLGQGAQGAALQGAQAQLQAGAIPQQTQQALDTALYQQFQQQQGYPFQVAQFLANIAEGTGALSGSTTTTTSPAGFFSDERLKTDIKKIGKTNDGQPIYSYKYKGEDRTQIGLMAQDVEKKHPSAIGLMGGYKTVDYKKATEDSERPAKFAGGGLVPEGFDPSSMGGAVTPDTEGEGFARGGDAIGPYGNVGLYGGAHSYVPGAMKNPHPHHFAMGGTPYAGGYVPDAGPQIQRGLMLPPKDSLPALPKTGLSSAMETGKNIQGMYNMGKTGLIGSAPTTADPSGAAGLIGGQGKMSGQNVFSQFKDWATSDPTKAEGGLIVHRDHYETGGDVDPYEPTKDPLSDVLKTQESAKHNTLATAKGGGPGAPQSGLSQLTQGLGAAKSLYGMGSDVASGLGSLGAGFSSAGNAAALDSALGPGFFAGNIGLGAEGASAAGAGLMGSIGTALGELGPLAFLGLASGGTADRQHFAGDDGESGAVLPLNAATVEAQPGLVPDDVAAAAAEEKETTGVPAKVKGLAVAPIVAQAEKAAEDERLAPTLGALRRIESGGDYGVTGPTSRKGDKPYGAYQIMGANIPSWTQAALGRAMTPEEFLASPEAQDATAKHRAGMYLKQYDDPRQVASMWLSGRPMEKAGDSADVLGTTVPKYVSMFDRYYGGQDLAPGDQRRTGPTPPGLVGRGMQPAPSEGEGTGLIDKVSSPNFLVPALGFVGSMLASQRPTLGGALGEGMLGGVGAYQAQQRQNAAMAKNVLDIVKDRFAVSVDPQTNQTVYFNKSTGQTISPAQYMQAVGGVADSMNVPRGVLGIPTSGTEIPTIGSSVTQPGQFSRPGDQGKPAGQQITQQTEGAKPAPKDEKLAPLVDIRDMSPTAQQQYVVEHAQQYGLVGDRDPAKMQAQVQQYRSTARSYSLQNNATEAAKYDQLAADAQKRMDTYLDQAVSSQVANNNEINKANVASSAEYMKGVESRINDYDRDRKAMTRLAQIYADNSLGRLSNVKADIGEWARQFGISLGDDFNAAPNDEALKIATSQAIDNVSYKHLGRAPAAGIKSELQTVAKPEMAPAAAYAVIGRTLGEMDHIHNRDMAYANKGVGTKVPQFLANWGDKDPQPYIKKAFEEIPVAKGADPKYVAGLEKTYGFQHKGAEQPSSGATQERQQAPLTAPVPEPIRNLQGLSYSPSRNQYRDAQGNIYDASGKRVQ